MGEKEEQGGEPRTNSRTMVDDTDDDLRRGLCCGNSIRRKKWGGQVRGIPRRRNWSGNVIGPLKNGKSRYLFTELCWKGWDGAGRGIHVAGGEIPSFKLQDPVQCLILTCEIERTSNPLLSLCYRHRNQHAQLPGTRSAVLEGAIVLSLRDATARQNSITSCSALAVAGPHQWELCRIPRDLPSRCKMLFMRVTPMAPSSSSFPNLCAGGLAKFSRPFILLLCTSFGTSIAVNIVTRIRAPVRVEH